MGVYRAARAALGSHAEAEDAAQDAFVLAWRRLDSFRGDASFRTWLLTIAWHQAINRRRSLVRWWKRTAPFEDEAMLRPEATVGRGERGEWPHGRPLPRRHGHRLAGDLVLDVTADIVHLVSGFRRTVDDASGCSRTAGRTPEQLRVEPRMRRDIVVAIRALSPKLRDALLLAQSGDYTYAEIGTMVHAPLGTIKWRIAEARRLVQKRLQELGHGQLG